MEYVNWESIEEFVCHDEGRLRCVLRHESQVFGPDNLDIFRVPAGTFVTQGVFLESIVAAQEFVLGFSQSWAGFDQVHCFNSFGQRWEVAYCLNRSARTSQINVYGISHTKHIIHQRPSARPNFHKVHTLALSALSNPFRHEPNPNQLTEDLANLWRGNEVSF